MPTRVGFRTARGAVVRLCHSGLPSERLRVEAFTRIGPVLGIEAVWWASVDPATLLPTSSLRLGLPDDTAGAFRENEDLHHDVNKFSDVARSRGAHAPRGDPG